MLREAVQSMKQSATHTSLLIVTILITILAVLLQYGQASNRIGELRASFQQPEFRTIEIIDERESYPLQVSEIHLLDQISSVNRVWSLSPSFDVKNPILPNNGRVSAAYLTGTFNNLPITLISGRMPNSKLEAIAPLKTTQNLGLDLSGGTISTLNGIEFTIVGYFKPNHVRAPQSILIYNSEESKIRSTVIEIDNVNNLDKVITNTINILNLNLATTTISKSEAIAKVSHTVDKSQQSYTTLTITTAISISILIVTLLSAMMINSRKQEFGRRRALGASRIFLLGLVTTQIVLTILLATIFGTILGIVTIMIFWPLGVPTLIFCIGLSGTLTLGSIIAQLPAALLAAFRDPVAVLRTP